MARHDAVMVTVQASVVTGILEPTDARKEVNEHHTMPAEIKNTHLLAMHKFHIPSSIPAITYT